MKSPKKMLLWVSLGVVGILGVLLSLYFFIGVTPTIQEVTSSNPSFGESSGRETVPANNSASALGQGEILIMEITPVPIAGFTFKKEGPRYEIEYLERETGNIYQDTADGNNKTRVSNTTVPGVQEAIWNTGGNRIWLRYLAADGETIKTFSASTTEPTTAGGEGGLEGIFLADNLNGVATNPKNKSYFYLQESGTGVSGFAVNPDGSNPVKIFSSRLREWAPQWVDANTLYLGTKPAATSNGSLFKLNIKNGQLTRMFSGPGMTYVVSPNNTYTFYSYTDPDSGFLSGVWNNKTSARTELGLPTLADKCAWNPVASSTLICAVPTNHTKGDYPDDWYQGTKTFTDTLWQIDVVSGTSTQLFDFYDQTNKVIDVMNPVISPDGRDLVFINKHNLSLWRVRLSSRVNESSTTPAQ